MKKDIPNDQLSPGDIPSADATWDEIQRFALSYDGYVRHPAGECARIANNRIHYTLDDLRTRLFFEQRRWRHFGEEPDSDAMQYIRNLVAEIRRRVT